MTFTLKKKRGGAKKLSSATKQKVTLFDDISDSPSTGEALIEGSFPRNMTLADIILKKFLKIKSIREGDDEKINIYEPISHYNTNEIVMYREKDAPNLHF